MDQKKEYYYLAPGEKASSSVSPEATLIAEKDLHSQQRLIALFNIGFRAGDLLIVNRLESLCRNRLKCAEYLRRLVRAQVTLRVLDLPAANALPDPAAALVILAETLESLGQSDLKKTGAGRPMSFRPANWEEVYGRMLRREITANEAMALTGTKRTHFYQLVKEQKVKDGQ